MTMDYNEVIIGFDLGYDSSVLTFYHQNNTEPMTVSSVPGEEKYQIPTPRDLFPLIEQKAELGAALLSNFFKMCLEKHFSVIHRLQHGGAPKKCGFSRTGRSDDRQYLSLFHRQRNIF